MIQKRARVESRGTPTLTDREEEPVKEPFGEIGRNSRDMVF